MANKRPALFIDAAGNEWSGFGPKPAWLKALVASGEYIQDYLNDLHPDYERKKAMLILQQKGKKMATATEMKAHVKAIDEAVKPKPMHRRRRGARAKLSTPAVTHPKRKYTKRDQQFWTAQEREHHQKTQQQTMKIKTGKFQGIRPETVAVDPGYATDQEWIEFGIDDQVYVPATHRYGVIKSKLQTSLVDPAKRVHMVDLVDNEGDNVRVEVEPSLMIPASAVDIKLPQNIENLLLAVVSLTQKTEQLRHSYQKLKTALSKSQYEARSKDLEQMFLMLRRTLHAVLRN